MKSRLLLLALPLFLTTISCNFLFQRNSAQLAATTPVAVATFPPTSTPVPTLTPTPTPTPTPVPAVRIESAEAAYFNGDWESAVREFQSAQAGSQEADIQTSALFGTGRTYLASGQSALAIPPLQQLIDGFPDSLQASQAYFLLGQAYYQQGLFLDAADAYSNYLARRPGIIDAYALELRGDALFSNGDYAGAADEYQAAMQSPSLKDPIYLQLKLARAYSLGGNFEMALSLYDDAFSRASDDQTRALIDLRKGQTFTSMGQPEQAYQAYLDAVNNYPSAYESYSALFALVQAGVSVDELQRGIIDYNAGEYGVALAALDRYLQNSPADPQTAYYYTGMASRALGSYEGALSAWDQVIQGDSSHYLWDEAYEQKAYTQWAYLDQYSQAIDTLLEFVSLAPTHARAGEFLFDAASVAERADKLEEAVDLWERVINEYPGYEQAPRALFLSGITRYRLKDYEGAQAAFRRLLALANTMGDRAMAHLWIGKSLMALGDETGARAAWSQAASLDPTGYYSERSIDLLKNRPPFTPPETIDLAFDPAAEQAEAETWLRTTFGLPEDSDLSGLGPLSSDGYLIRGKELWDLGMLQEARAEFEQLRTTVKDDPSSCYRLARYLDQIGLYRPATMAARRVLDLAGMSDADTMNAPMFFNRLRFGTHYADLIMPAAQDYDFNPLFLFSVVRQESLFESFVRSSAAARGLMQIIPSTGETIARNLGWPENYTDDDLYRPTISIRFGVDYLHDQRNRFKGDLYAALAAYNGGPGNAMAWKALSGDDPDLFLEVIRFSETRSYIQRIYEIFSIYRRLYSRTM